MTTEELESLCDEKGWKLYITRTPPDIEGSDLVWTAEVYFGGRLGMWWSLNDKHWSGKGKSMGWAVADLLTKITQYPLADEAEKVA